MMDHTPQEDLVRDAHLMAALRHAPDRDVAPPPEVTARILAAARAAVAAAPKPPVAPLWQRLAAWLVQPRIGAAFGTLAVATLVGLLWATREAPVSEPAPQVAMPAGGEAASASAVAAPQAASPAPSPEPAVANTAGRVARPSAAPAPRRELPVAKQAAPAATTAEVAAAAPAVPGAPPTPHPTRSAQAMPPSDPAAAVAERRAAADTLADAATGRPAAAAPSPAVGSTSGLLARSRQEAAAAAADPLASIDALLGRAPPGLAWQREGRTIAHGDAQRQWWAALQSATQGRWRRDLPAAPEAAPPWIELREDGRAVAAWWLDGGVLRLRDSQAQSWSAPVTEAQRRDWLAAAALW